MTYNKDTKNIALEYVQGKAYLVFHHCDMESQRWRLWIPEVFIAERDNDRFLKCATHDAQEIPISVQWETTGNWLSYTYSNVVPGPIAYEYKV